ncbi:C-type lectin domain family 4 member G-like [Rhynchocyon petersi]
MDDDFEYSKLGRENAAISGGHWGCWERKCLLVALVLVVTAVLWTLVLSILLSKGSNERWLLLGHQNLLRTNASKQETALDFLQEEVGACRSCCSGAQAQLQVMQAELGEAKKKLLEQGSTLNELRKRVTKDMAQATRDREDIRSELFRALEAAKFGNETCDPCPTSWKPFAGSCYLFAEGEDSWQEAQKNCATAGAHLVIVGSLEEQTFLSQNTSGYGFWVGLRAVRRARKIQGYQWVDNVPLTFSHWNTGEPNDSRGLEDCVMMLDTGLWNDAPCNIRGKWICEKRRRC